MMYSALAASDATDALHGLRVVEMGQLIAGQVAGNVLGDFGVDVITIESPDGRHPLRGGCML